MDQIFKIKEIKITMLNFKWTMITSTNQTKNIFSRTKTVKTQLKFKIKINKKALWAATI